jgi:hypothetical protein
MPLYELALLRFSIGNLTSSHANIVKPERLKDRNFAGVNNATIGMDGNVRTIGSVN